MSKLRNRLIRLAHQHPEIRKDLVPILAGRPQPSEKIAMPSFQRIRGKLPLGRTVVTRGVNNEMQRDPAFAEFVAKSLTRHANGDWGDLDSNDRKMNDEAMRTGEDRIMSVYKAPGMETIWIITEWDRSASTVLFPSEY